MRRDSIVPPSAPSAACCWASLGALLLMVVACGGAAQGEAAVPGASPDDKRLTPAQPEFIASDIHCPSAAAAADTVGRCRGNGKTFAAGCQYEDVSGNFLCKCQLLASEGRDISMSWGWQCGERTTRGK